MCKEVPSPITQVYKIDTHGYWKGDTHFSLSHAIYEFDMEGFAHSTGDLQGSWGQNFATELSASLLMRQSVVCQIIFCTG